MVTESSSVASRISSYMLPASRLAYSAVGGLSLIAATFWIDNSATGRYVYLVGIASVVASIAGLGVERMLARRIAAREIQPCMPKGVITLRAFEGVLITIAFVVVGLVVSSPGFNAWLGASCAMFVASRVIYYDLECIWVASRGSTFTLAMVIVLNAVTTGLGIVVGCLLSSPLVMVLGTGLGNALGAAILLFLVPVKHVQVDGGLAEARGTALSLGLAALYARADLLIVGLMSVPLGLVAVYGIVLRCFDALVILRGSLAQQDSRDAAAMSIGARAVFVAQYGVRTTRAYVLISMCCVLIGVLLVHTAGLQNVEGVGLFLLAIAGLPLFFSHQASTVLILSDRRNHLLFWGSLVACALSVLIKYLLIRTWSLNGAVVSLCVVELVSFVVFSVLYLGPKMLAVWEVVATACVSAGLSILVVWWLVL